MVRLHCPFCLSWLDASGFKLFKSGPNLWADRAKGCKSCYFKARKAATSAEAQQRLLAPSRDENEENETPGTTRTTSGGSKRPSRSPLAEIPQQQSARTDDGPSSAPNSDARAKKKPRNTTRLEYRGGAELAGMVRKTTAQKQAVERELRELKKGLGGEDVLNAMKLVASRGSKLFQNLSRALLKGTLGMDRCGEARSTSWTWC
mmetsp:Transcript_12318/g.25863  ORF Transcript_12318/g.25863 Transcript_12318/m.25863 type:complete len:204 (+) Transcript_12318:172-783(+)